MERLEAVDGDEDLFVVIIGDEENKPKSNHTFIIKEEIVAPDYEELEVEEILEAAAKHGEVLPMQIKAEKIEDETEYLDSVSDGEYLPESQEMEENSEDPDSSDGIVKARPKLNPTSKDKHRYKMLPRDQQKSFVKDLKQQYPELAKNRELLIESLSAIMLAMKPPAPPKDYFYVTNEAFECATCSRICETEPAMSRHWQEKHGLRYLVCFACGVDFRSKTNLYKHEKRCNGVDAIVVLKARARMLGAKARSRPFLLDPSEIKAKVKVAKPKQRLLCPYCPGDFSSSSSLRAHINAHNGERPHRCPFCTNAYTSASALKRHLLNHGDIWYYCDHCKRGFKTKSSLIAHLDTHKPFRKFPCEKCGRRFAQKMALQLHIDRAHYHLPPPCPCQLCPKRYPRMSLLKNHMLKAHGMNLITRKMFYKSLPYMTDTQIAQAKVVLKSDLNPARPNDFVSNVATKRNIYYSEFNENFDPDNLVEQTKHYDNNEYQLIEAEEILPVDIEVSKEVHVKEEYAEIPVTEIEESQIPEDVLAYLKKLQNGEVDNSGAMFLVIEQNGDVISVDESNIDQYRNQLMELEGEINTEEGKRLPILAQVAQKNVATEELQEHVENTNDEQYEYVQYQEDSAEESHLQDTVETGATEEKYVEEDDGTNQESIIEEFEDYGASQESLTEEFENDGAIQESLTEEFENDGAIQESLTEEFEDDGAIQESLTEEFENDGATQESIREEFENDGATQESIGLENDESQENVTEGLENKEARQETVTEGLDGNESIGYVIDDSSSGTQSVVTLDVVREPVTPRKSARIRGKKETHN